MATTPTNGNTAANPSGLDPYIIVVGMTSGATGYQFNRVTERLKKLGFRFQKEGKFWWKRVKTSELPALRAKAISPIEPADKYFPPAMVDSLMTQAMRELGVKA